MGSLVYFLYLEFNKLISDSLLCFTPPFVQKVANIVIFISSKCLQFKKYSPIFIIYFLPLIISNWILIKQHEVNKALIQSSIHIYFITKSRYFDQSHLPQQTILILNKDKIIYIQLAFNFLYINLYKAVENFSMFLANNGSIIMLLFFQFYFFPYLYRKTLLSLVLSYRFLIIQRLVTQFQQMNFILNPNPLPIYHIQKKIQSLQYYQWRYKQKIHQQEENLKKIKKYQKMIEKEQQNENRQNLYKRRMHHQGSFYDYNMQWKKKVDNKIDEQKNLKLLEISKHEQKAMKGEIGEQKKQLNSSYQGPVQGWQKHFQNYLKTKSSGLILNNQQLTFEPKINERSRKMAEGMTGKVEDRLILFGEFIKMKNQQQLNKLNNDNMNHSFNVQKYSTNHSNQSQFFYRLYKEGEQANKRRRDLVLNQQHSFQPKINKLPQEIQDRIMKRRKPLYYIKNSISNSNSEKNMKTNKQDSNKTYKGDFQSFLKRNQALLDMKKKMMLELREKQQERQNIQKSQCTFTPILNANSKRIQKNVEQTNKAFEQKIMKKIQNSKIQSQPSQPALQNMQNIQISKLTVPDIKDTSRIDESESLFLYKMQVEQKTLKKQLFDSSNGNLVSYKSSRIEGVSKIVLRKTEQKSSNNHPSTQVTGNNEQDSIEKMKNSEWQSQLEQIQNNIQNMMSRASK